MKLIVGLGNPGQQYQYTRHNIGFMFIDFYAKHKNSLEFKKKFNGEYTQLNLNQEKVILFKPMTYMNLSGEAIQEIMHFFHILPQDLLVIYDDLDLPFASLRLRKKGNAGGHNGMKNILLHLHTNEFDRIRVGIGKPTGNQIDFVLSSFSKSELESLNHTFEKMIEAVDLFSMNQFDLAMNKLNGEKI